MKHKESLRSQSSRQTTHLVRQVLRKTRPHYLFKRESRHTLSRAGSPHLPFRQALIRLLKEAGLLMAISHLFLVSASTTTETTTRTIAFWRQEETITMRARATSYSHQWVDASALALDRWPDREPQLAIEATMPMVRALSRISAKFKTWSTTQWWTSSNNRSSTWAKKLSRPRTRAPNLWKPPLLETRLVMEIPCAGRWHTTTKCYTKSRLLLPATSDCNETKVWIKMIRTTQRRKSPKHAPYSDILLS